jgi:hypothetical protein
MFPKIENSDRWRVTLWNADSTPRVEPCTGHSTF